MNEKQFARFLEANDKSTREAIELHVNGKIRVMDEKLSAHILEEKTFRDTVEPYLQAVTGLKVIRNVIVWLGAVFIAYVAFKNSIKW